MKELKGLKDDMETYQDLVTRMEDIETMIEMGYEENDPELVPEIQEMLAEFEESFDAIRVKTLLSGEYDTENASIVEKRTFGEFGDPAGYEETLYVTENGKFFLYTNGGAESVYTEENIKRMSADKAAEWQNA